MSLLSIALEYYDKNNELYANIKNQIAYIEGVAGFGDSQTSSLIFYDSDKKILFRSKFGVIGVVYNSHNIWVWGWAHPNINYENVATIKNVLFHAISLTADKDDYAIIKSELITSRFGISDETQIDIHCAIASYMAHIPLIIKLNQPIPLAGELIPFVSPYKFSDISVYMYIMNPPTIK